MSESGTVSTHFTEDMANAIENSAELGLWKKAAEANFAGRNDLLRCEQLCKDAAQIIRANLKTQNSGTVREAMKVAEALYKSPGFDEYRANHIELERLISGIVKKGEMLDRVTHDNLYMIYKRIDKGVSYQHGKGFAVRGHFYSDFPSALTRALELEEGK